MKYKSSKRTLQHDRQQPCARADFFRAAKSRRCCFETIERQRRCRRKGCTRCPELSDRDRIFRAKK